MQKTNSNQSISEIATRISKEINNEIEYQLTIDEFHRLRNNEYNKLVLEEEIEDTDDNWN